VLDAQQPWSEPRLVRARESGVEYFVDHSGEHFYIVTNADGATNYKVPRHSQF
jgi:oligopeptidase B